MCCWPRGQVGCRQAPAESWPYFHFPEFILSSSAHAGHYLLSSLLKPVPSKSANMQRLLTGPAAQPCVQAQRYASPALPATSRSAKCEGLAAGSSPCQQGSCCPHSVLGGRTRHRSRLAGVREQAVLDFTPVERQVPLPRHVLISAQRRETTAWVCFVCVCSPGCYALPLIYQLQVLAGLAWT